MYLFSPVCRSRSKTSDTWENRREEDEGEWSHRAGQLKARTTKSGSVKERMEGMRRTGLGANMGLMYGRAGAKALELYGTWGFARSRSPYRIVHCVRRNRSRHAVWIMSPDCSEIKYKVCLRMYSMRAGMSLAVAMQKKVYRPYCGTPSSHHHGTKKDEEFASTQAHAHT